MLPGVHRVKKPRADGGVIEFWYAWRGGPQILRAAAKSDALLAKEVAVLTPAATQAYAAAQTPQSDTASLYGLIKRYLTPLAGEPDTPPPHLRKLAPRTISDRKKLLNRVQTEIGQMELKALEAPRARSVLLKWRGQKASTPKTADELLNALSIVIQWAVDNGELKTNPVEHFERLYSSNRAEAIWEKPHLEALLRHAEPEMAHAVNLAIHTGLRLNDLILLPRHAVGADAIVWQTGKSRGRRTIVIPMTEGLRRTLAAIPARDATTVLTSGKKKPWSMAGVASAMRRCKLDAQAYAEKQDGANAKSGIGHLRWHDMRGTAATNFIRAGLPLEDVATILGWEKDRVEQVAMKYVTGQEVGRAIVERMKRNERRT